MKLRDYQIRCMDALRASMHAKRNRLLVKAPCSFGKTIVFCEIARIANERGRKTLVLIDSVALISQTYLKLAHFTNDASIYCASLSKKELSSITVASIESINKTDALEAFDIVIIDEAHSSMNRWQKFLGNYNKHVIGFTATPFDAKGRAIYGKDCYFDKLDFSMSASELVDLGIITLMKYGTEKEETKIDFSSVKIGATGDYSDTDIAKIYERQEHKIQAQVSDMLSRITGRNSVLIMCSSIHHAKTVSALIKWSKCYHSEMTIEERAEVLREFDSGSLRFMVGVTAIYKGLDVTRIDCLVLMRPTRSYPFYIQFAGRGVRKHEGKEDCLFLDYGQTVEKLGFYEDFKESKFQEKHEGIAPEFYPKKCPKCQTLMKPQLMTCPECGHIFPREITKNLTSEAYMASYPNSGIIRDFELVENSFLAPDFYTINVFLEDGRSVRFTYSAHSEWASELYWRHSHDIKTGSFIRWKLIPKNGRQYNNLYYIGSP